MARVRNEKKKGFFSRLRFWWKVLKWCVVLGSILFTGGWWYLHHLGEWAERYFTRSFQWKLPSRIYSDAGFLYVGLDIGKQGLRDKLDRLGYREVPATKAPGEYTRGKTTFDIYLHDFEYPGERFAGFPARLGINGTTIQSIEHLATKDRVATLRLEPELIGSIFDEQMEDRTLVTLAQVPDACRRGVIEIEDARFYQHEGVDPRGLARALFSNLKAMRVVEGGSTLTQQLVKNYFLTQERTYKRKLQEFLIALALEQRHSKDEILEAYVNEIYLGQRGASSVSGFGEAAHLYFGKEIHQLDIAECALLAGMIRGPGRYNPLTHPDTAKERRDFVIAQLLEKGAIDATQAARAKAQPIVTPKQSRQLIAAPFFIDFVKQQLHALYPEDRLSAEGMRIFTTLDVAGQLAAQAAVKDGLAQLETTYAAKLPKNHVEPLQGALVSIQPQTGYIRAMVGGRDYADTKFNRATQAKRQSGSTFKPFVYLTAFDPSRAANVIAPSTYIDDVSFSVESGGQMWTPKNYDNQEHGQIAARTALLQSFNIATAKTAIDTGLEAVLQTARDAGIASPLQAVPSMALGAFEVTPLELATAYTIFPNGGALATPLSIMHVVTKEGEALQRKSIDLARRFDAGPIYLVTDVLKDVVTRGTAAGSRALGFTGIAAGKTGTTSDYRDAWFVGFTPELVALTWVGFDDNASMRLSGAQAALPIWVKYMQTAAPNNTQDFPMPTNVVLVKIDPLSGHAWTNDCPEGLFAPFLETAQPSERCALHE